MIEHTAPQSGIATHGAWVATAGYDNRVILWRDRVAVARGNHDHLANHCAFDRSGTLLVSASSDYTARIWSVPTLRLVSVLGDHEDDVEMAVFDASGARVATASRDHRVRIFDVNGTLLHRLAGHTADVVSVAWLGDRRLASSSDDGTIRIWNADTGALESTRTLGTETDTLAIAPDGTLFAGNDRGELAIVHPNGTEQRIRAHRAGIKRLALDPSGTRLVSCSYDRTLRSWRVGASELEPLGTAELPAIGWARAVALDERGRIVLGTFGSTYAIHDGAWQLDGIGDTPGLNAVHVAHGAVYAIGDAGVALRDGVAIGRTGSSCNFIAVWRDRIVAGGQLGALVDCETGDVLYQHASPLNCFAIDARDHLLVGTYTGEGLRFRGPSSSPEVLALHDQAVKGIATHGDTIFSVSAAGDARFDAELVPGAHHKIANGVCSLADGRFASVSRDRLLRIWTGTRADVIATPHAHSIKCLARAGDRIATGSYDGTVAIYEPSTGNWIVRRPTTAGISSLAAVDDRCVLAASYDGRIYRVEIA